MKTNDELFNISTKRSVEITIDLLLFIAEALKKSVIVTYTSAVEHILSKAYSKNEACLLCFLVAQGKVTMLASLLRTNIDQEGEEKAVKEFQAILAEQYSQMKKETQN